MSLAWLNYHLRKNENDLNTQETVKSLQSIFIDLAVAVLEVDSMKRAHDTIFACICDTILMFPPQLVEQKPAMETLVFKPPPRVQDTIIKYVADQMMQSAAEKSSKNISDTESMASMNTTTDDGNDVGNLDRLTMRRNNIASIARLIMAGQLDPSAIAPLIRYYAKNSDYNDLIKITLSKCREISQEETGKAIHSGLVSVYLQCMRNQKDSTYSRSAPELVPAKELARKLAQSFGVDLKRASPGVIALHIAGIKFAFKQNTLNSPPPDLPYLDLLNDFVPKLLRQDRTLVKAQLDLAVNALAPVAQPTGEALEALRTYTKSLTADDGMGMLPPPSAMPPSTVGTTDTVVAGRGRGKRKISVGSVGWATPGLTSTAVRPGVPSKPNISNGNGNHMEDDDDDDDMTLSLLQGPRPVSPKRSKPEPPSKIEQSSDSESSSESSDNEDANNSSNDDDEGNEEGDE